MKIDELCAYNLTYVRAGNSFSGNVKIADFLFTPDSNTINVFSAGIVTFSNFEYSGRFSQNSHTAISLENCTLGGTRIDELLLETAGTVSKESSGQIGFSYFHAPVTSADTTWRYEDHIIPSQKQLHLKISRLVEEASLNSEARVAVTDPVNWYAETKFGALAETVLKGLEKDKWNISQLVYRNTSDQSIQVRVWECVTGSTDGGYLKVESATGGAF